MVNMAWVPKAPARRSAIGAPNCGSAARTGSIVHRYRDTLYCFDVDHKVRLIDIKGDGGYPLCAASVSGCMRVTLMITHIFCTP